MKRGVLQAVIPLQGKTSRVSPLGDKRGILMTYEGFWVRYFHVPLEIKGENVSSSILELSVSAGVALLSGGSD